MAAFDVISNFHNSAIPLRSLNPLTMSLIRLLSDKAFGMAAKYFQRTVANKLRVSGECTAGLRGRCKSVMLGILVVRRSENWVEGVNSVLGLNIYRIANFKFLSIVAITGLRYEDLINEEDRDFKEALSLASPEVQTARTRRLKRALDLNLKQKNFLDYCPDVEQDTFKFEIYEDFKKIRARNQEYALLNQYKK